MLYQVVAKSPIPPEQWDYYPCWWPMDDESEARQWVEECVSHGYEAAVLRARSFHRLAELAEALIEWQDTRVLPSVRYTPGDSIVPRDEGLEREATESTLASPNQVYGEWRRAGEHPSMRREDDLDALRWRLERGSGGDVDSAGGLWRQHPHFPERMDVLSAWLRLRERTHSSALGGRHDGWEPLVVRASRERVEAAAMSGNATMAPAD